MIKVVYCIRRKAGLTHADFLAYWELVHAPIVLANVEVLRISSYVRTVPLDRAFSPRVERPGTMQPRYDGIAELAWATEDDMRHAFESEPALAVQRRLALDEHNFIDQAASSRWIAHGVCHI
jgi:hypothetical protein